jgi:iron uptake system component EfeO
VLLVGVFAGGDPGGVAAASGPARAVSVRASNAGCSPAELRLPAGPASFTVTGTGEYGILDGGRIVAEAENLAAGIEGHFSLTLQPGAYTLRCSGGPDGRLVVTGARQTVAGVDAYRRYLERETSLLVTRTHAFATALRTGDAERAKALFASAREPYEAIEPVAESFGDLDPRIDARVNDLEPGQKWTGFHAIEKQLWVRHTTRGTAKLADTLEADIAQLQSLVKTVKLEPAQIANGATDLLGEVSKSKVTGEEDRYSHTDLSDFAANVDGARAAFDAIRPALAKRDRSLATLIEGRFETVDGALAVHRDGDGFVAYDTLGRGEVRALSQVVDALAEPLSQAPARALAG